MATTPTAPLISLGMIESLICFDTTSRESNLKLIAFVQNYLEDHGVESELIYNDDKQKANLYATIGPKDQSGVMLSGHTDVVPVDGQNWTNDPFTLKHGEDRLFGRGTCDMKSFIAITLAYLPEMQKRTLKTPIHLALSYDEEIGCIGARGLVDMLKNAPVKPAMCIVGEPTDMKVMIAHKGKLSYRATVRGFWRRRGSTRWNTPPRPSPTLKTWRAASPKTAPSTMISTCATPPCIPASPMAARR